MTRDKILPRSIDEEMRSSYIDYSMSVIISRALPDVRDGLKPVHRRVLYGMHEQGLLHNRKYVKSVRAIGHVMANYHPHGDMAIYNTIVRMVQDFSLRYPMIDGQGNFGSVDGDEPAAMRYTEVRLQRIAEEVLNDIDKDTVDFVDNFDGTTREPTVLPSLLPQLLINGSAGIAVGMATNIPPHNLDEVIDACLAYIDNPELESVDLMSHIQGPDFPTGGIIYGREGIHRAYLLGRGSITIRGQAEIEEKENGREVIIITELPYQVNKALLIERIAALVREKKIEGIADLRDESDRDGMRIFIELKRDAQSQVVLNQLYKHSNLQTTFGCNMLALVNNQPKVLTLKEMIHHFIEHRHDVVERRTRFELKRAEARAHIVEGLLKAVDHIDEIIAIIKQSESVPAARENLMNRFDFSEEQANAILDLQLRRLTALEREKLEAEYQDLLDLIGRLQHILSSRENILEVVRGELEEMQNRYADKRRTKIVDSGSEFTIEELIPDEDVVITVSHSGYIKRMPLTTYRSQRRGGRGVTGMETKDEDFVEHMFIASTHSSLLLFTNLGRCHWLKVYELPAAGRMAKGKAIVNLLPIEREEKIRTILPVREFDDDHFIVFVTKMGLVKKTSLKAYSRPRRGGIIALSINAGDSLIEAVLTDGSQEIIIATADGQAIRFNEIEARPMGRSAAGVKGVSLENSDEVVGALIIHEDTTLLTVTENGYGKRSDYNDYRITHRGGKGVINIKTTERNGRVVSIKEIHDDDELMIITKNGVIIRMPCTGIRVIGRNAQGVKLINLGEDDQVIDIARLPYQEEENGDNHEDGTH